MSTFIPTNSDDIPSPGDSSENKNIEQEQDHSITDPDTLTTSSDWDWTSQQTQEKKDGVFLQDEDITVTTPPPSPKNEKTEIVSPQTASSLEEEKEVETIETNADHLDKQLNSEEDNPEEKDSIVNETIFKTPIGRDNNSSEEDDSMQYSWSKNMIKASWYNFFKVNTAIVLTLLTFIAGIAFVWIWKVNRRSVQDINHDSMIMNIYKSVVELLDQTIAYPWIDEVKSQNSSLTEKSITNIVKGSIPFMYKKEILDTMVTSLINDIITKQWKLRDINLDISKYWFIHPDTMLFFDSNKEEIPIMTSLHTIETIKFWTAFQIFSMLDSFIQQVSQKLGIEKRGVASLMQNYSVQWEKDISAYLSACYLNPYEQLPDCNVIGDFDNYLRYEGGDDNVKDPSIFKALMALIDDKLENSLIPSVEIRFDNFNPHSSEIWFTVRINTLIDDEMAFLSQKILNPHVYIASTLISLLKQSLFIIWDSIAVNEIKVGESDVSIGNIKIPVKTSYLSFRLPFQKSPEREIYDYYNFDDEIDDIDWDDFDDIFWNLELDFDELEFETNDEELLYQEDDDSIEWDDETISDWDENENDV